MSFGFTQGFHNRNTLGFTTESGDFRLTHENRHKYLVTSKCFFQSILLQDTIIQPNYYLITRYSYSVRKVSYYKILLLFSVSNYYLQDNKIRYCPSLGVANHPTYSNVVNLDCDAKAIAESSTQFYPKE